MVEPALDMTLKRLRTQSNHYNAASQIERRIAACDRRVRSIQVPIERRSGMERRLRTQLVRYPKLKDISWQLMPD
jgi:hypothetical protein